MESKKINKYLSFIMVLLLTLLSVPIDAYAANTAAYLAVTIDTSSNTYRGTVFVSDEWSRNNNYYIFDLKRRICLSYGRLFHTNWLYILTSYKSHSMKHHLLTLLNVCFEPYLLHLSLHL
jgi:hypothetical protein